MTKLSNLESVHNLLISKFSLHWWVEYELNKITQSSFPESKFELFIKNSYQEITDSLILSVLTGEYIFENEFEAKLLQIQELLKKIQSYSFEEFPDANIQSLTIYFKENFIDSIKLCLDIYIGHQKRVIDRIKLNSRRYIIDIDNNLRQSVEDLSSEEFYYKRIELFDFNIQVSYYDHFLDNSFQSFNALEAIKYNLEKTFSQYSIHCNLILGKCKFLVSKFILRKIHENKNNSFERLYTRINLIDKKANDSLDNFHDENYLELINTIKIQYEIIPDWEEQLITVLENDNFEKNYSVCSLILLQKYIKYYKDIKPNLQELKKIRNHIELKLTNEIQSNLKSSYNIFALKIALNYSINNEFSCFIEICSNLEDAKKYYDEILECQEKTQIKNFFPQFKYLKYLQSNINNIKNDNQGFSQSTYTKEVLLECNRVIKSYDESVKWINLNVNYIFQLPFNECFLKLKNSDLKIFISSYSVLPINKELHQENFEEIKLNIERISQNIEIYDSVKEGLRHLEEKTQGNIKKVDDLEKETRDANKKTIEIVGLFTAVIAFIFSSIPAFKFVDTAFEAMLFMISLGSTLAFFILCILLITRGLGNVKYYITIGIFILFTIAAWSLLLFNGTPINKKNSIKVSDIELEVID